jgi:hypothetical protein
MQLCQTGIAFLPRSIRVAYHWAEHLSRPLRYGRCVLINSQALKASKGRPAPAQASGLGEQTVSHPEA